MAAPGVELDWRGDLALRVALGPRVALVPRVALGPGVVLYQWEVLVLRVVLRVVLGPGVVLNLRVADLGPSVDQVPGAVPIRETSLANLHRMGAQDRDALYRLYPMTG